MYEDVFIVIWVNHECRKMFKQPMGFTLQETSHCVTDTVFKINTNTTVYIYITNSSCTETYTQKTLAVMTCRNM